MNMATIAYSRTRALAKGWPGDDFPAWISPMLVKELRQGVQSGVFFWTFLVFQVVLSLLFSIQVLSGSGGFDAWTWLFWFAAVVAVSVIVPLRGLGAVSGERVGNGLDLLALTRLSATRIVLGKWTALVAQSAVVAVTLLPYCTLRYFFGGVDVLTELRGLGWILAAGAVVAAAAVALSTLHLGIRIGIIVAAVPAAYIGFVGIIMESRSGMMARWWAWSPGQGWIVAILAIYTFALLEFAAARIAPPAENHAARKRIFALILAAAWPIVGWLAPLPAALPTFLATGPLLFCYAVGAMLDRPSRVRTVFLPFRRAGIAGRVAAAVFTPGWASGLVFLALVAGACGAGLVGAFERFAPQSEQSVPLAFATLLLAAIVFPLPVTSRLAPLRNPLLVYFLLQLICFMTFVFANGFKPFHEPWAEYETGRMVTLPFPLGAACCLLAMGRTMTTSALEAAALASTVAGLIVIGVVLMAVARSWLREFAAVGRLIRGDERESSLWRSAVRVAPVGRVAVTQPWAWRGDDFPAWLPPMLVRESRQGVQSGVFAWTFIGIQGAMFALMTWAVGTFGGSMEGSYARDFSAFFWLVIAAAIVVVVPLRGLTAVSGERVGNNLDLVRLSRLSATRIIVGKWLAIAGQGLLVTAALLPYLVLRYFLGGVNVVDDLEAFGWLAVASLAVAAAAIALSTLPLWMRIATGLVAVVVGFVPAAELMSEVMYGRLSFTSLSGVERLWIVAGIIVYTVAFLEYASARIAPPAENHAARKRLLAVGLAATWAIVGIFGSQVAAGTTFLVTAPLVLCYAIESLLEKPMPIASLYRPFRRWGFMGRIAAGVFTPGWATAVPFVAIVAGLCMAGWLGWFSAMVVSGSERWNSFWIASAVGCLIAAAVIYPLPALVWLPRKWPRLRVYALVHIACFLVFVYLAAMAPSGSSQSWRDWGGWVITLPFPLAALPAYLQFGFLVDLEAYALTFIIAAAGTTLVVLATVADPWLREIRVVMRLIDSEQRATGTALSRLGQTR